MGVDVEYTPQMFDSVEGSSVLSISVAIVVEMLNNLEENHLDHLYSMRYRQHTFRPEFTGRGQSRLSIGLHLISRQAHTAGEGEAMVASKGVTSEVCLHLVVQHVVA